MLLAVRCISNGSLNHLINCSFPWTSSNAFQGGRLSDMFSWAFGQLKETHLDENSSPSRPPRANKGAGPCHRLSWRRRREGVLGVPPSFLDWFWARQIQKKTKSPGTLTWACQFGLTKPTTVVQPQHGQTSCLSNCKLSFETWRIFQQRMFSQPLGEIVFDVLASSPSPLKLELLRGLLSSTSWRFHGKLWQPTSHSEWSPSWAPTSIPHHLGTWATPADSVRWRLNCPELAANGKGPSPAGRPWSWLEISNPPPKQLKGIWKGQEPQKPQFNCKLTACQAYLPMSRMMNRRHRYRANASLQGSIKFCCWDAGMNGYEWHSCYLVGILGKNLGSQHCKLRGEDVDGENRDQQERSCLEPIMVVMVSRQHFMNCTCCSTTFN